MATRIKFADPSFKDELIDEMLSLMHKVLKSGWLTSGPNVEKLESFFTSYLNNMPCVATNSCTAALHLAALLSHVERKEVIVPAQTFVSTANAVLYAGGTPVFADINGSTLNIDPKDVERKITNNTAAIIIVHLAGLPCNMDDLLKIARDYDLLLIEDCAHAHGARYRGSPCGSFGDFSCFSFYPTKVIGGAEGGLLATKRHNDANHARILVNQGRSGIGPMEINEIGYNYRMNELQASVILPQLAHLKEIVQYRNRIAKMYEENLSLVEGIELLEVPSNVVHSYYSYIVKVFGKRDEIIHELHKAGIETSIMYHPIHLQPIYQNLFNYSPGLLPVTEDVCSRIISLPLHGNMGENDVAFVCETLKKILASIM